MPAVICEQHSFLANEKDAIFPGRQLSILEIGWPFAAVVPCQFDGRQVAASREFIMHDQPLSRPFRASGNGRSLGVYTDRMPQLERPERQVRVVTGHVGQRPAAEVPPASPVERKINW